MLNAEFVEFSHFCHCNMKSNEIFNDQRDAEKKFGWTLLTGSICDLNICDIIILSEYRRWIQQIFE